MSNKKLNDKQMAEIKSNFDFFDGDSNGRIDEKEFAKLLQVIEPKATNEEAERGFLLIDENGDGSIDFPEFLVWWEQCWWQY